jgi:membrane protease subunit (stomatin/prohibitin family)
MGFLGDVKSELGSQFIEIIQWLDDSRDTLVYRFPVRNQEIKMGAQLTVRENQVALMVNEGKAADLFRPGRYRLETQNLPILADLKGWKYGFRSPFRAEVYFFNTSLVPDLKWGTANPVMMRDADFGAIRLRAFGTYAIRVSDPKVFFREIVGTRGLTGTEDVAGQLRSITVSRLSDALAESKIPALELSSRYDELSASIKAKLAPEFGAFGIELSKFFIENVSLPEEVEAAIDQRSKLGVLGDRLGQYTQMQAAESIPIAAANPGGLAGAGAGLGAGIAVGGAFGQALGASASGALPPPPPGSAGGTPPLPGARWSVTVAGATYGPYTDEQIRAMVKAGQVDPAALAWHPQAAAWAPLNSYLEFRSESAAAPPPPPPPKSSA